MAGYFSQEDLERLSKGREDAREKFNALRERYIFRTYRTDRGREYAHQGFCRRLDTMVRCIDLVFNVLPPQQEAIPDQDDVVAATVFIQGFVMNAFGCLDNLAWIWIYETEFKDRKGEDINPKSVGLGEGYWYLRKQFTKPFQKYVRGRKDCFRHLTEFRDTLAHRIPLYIPPYVIPDAKLDEYNQLAAAAIATAEWDDGKKAAKEYERLKSEQMKLGVFRPWMTHSLTEKSPQVVFHYQLLQDFVTVEEFGREMLDELDRMRERRGASDLRAPGPNKTVQWVIIVLAALAACFALYMRFLQ